MKYEIITKENFNSITSFEGPVPKYINRRYGYKKVDNEIQFYSSSVVNPCIYYIKYEDKFAYSYDPNLVVEYAKSHNIPLSDNYEALNNINDNIRAHVKPSITKHYKYSLSTIEYFKSVKVNYDGVPTVVYSRFKPYTKDIRTHFAEFVKFLKKWKGIINKVIDDKLFVPTITGGLDTRAFIGLYKDRVKELNGYFISPVKRDGKNNIAQGEFEVEISRLVAKNYNIRCKIFTEDEMKEYFTLSGFFNDNANSYENPNDIEYIKKIIEHAYDNDHQFVNKLNIFLDEDYLQFKQEGELFRVMMIMYLLPDSFNIPFTSGTSLFNRFPQGAHIYPLLKDVVLEAQKILKNKKREF